MPQLAYFLLYVVVRLFALLPFFVLYLLSDILYLIVYKLIGYRKKVVRKNLKHSFPSFSQQQLLKIEKEFYHHFCDLFVETIKLSSMSTETIKQRFSVTNMEVVEKLFAQGKSCISLSGHYGNWEWSAAYGLYIKPPAKALFLYKQVKNQAFDKLIQTLRQRFSVECIEKDFALRKMLQYKKQEVCWQTLIRMYCSTQLRMHQLHFHFRRKHLRTKLIFHQPCCSLILEPKEVLMLHL